MEASLLSSSSTLKFTLPTTQSRIIIHQNHAKSTARFIHTRRCNKLMVDQRRMISRIDAINNISSPPDPAQVDITWQILVGAIAGVVPFIVAGIEFSKRIIAQRRCEVCAGSGIVWEEDEYFRCPECGGFLPWQSWKRFFTG